MVSRHLCGSRWRVTPNTFRLSTFRFQCCFTFAGYFHVVGLAVWPGLVAHGFWHPSKALLQRTCRNRAATCYMLPQKKNKNMIKRFVTWYHSAASDRMGPQNRHEPEGCVAKWGRGLSTVSNNRVFSVAGCGKTPNKHRQEENNLLPCAKGSCWSEKMIKGCLGMFSMCTLSNAHVTIKNYWILVSAREKLSWRPRWPGDGIWVLKNHHSTIPVSFYDPGQHCLLMFVFQCFSCLHVVVTFMYAMIKASGSH